VARRPRLMLAVVAAGALAAACMGGTFAAFTGTASNEGNALTAASDFRAPEVTRSAIAHSGSATPGFIKQGGTYFVYAQVAPDSGSPASGILAVTADVAEVTTGQGATPLVAGSYSAGGASYNYRSAPLVADAVLSEGEKSYSVTATDVATNGKTLAGLSVTVDNTAPGASDVQTANGSTTVGRAQEDDTLTLTFSEPIEPGSVLSGWDGSATNVVVRLTNGGLLGLGDDDLEIRNAANSAALPFGRIDLKRTDYADGLLGGSVDFGAGGNASTMTMTGSTVTVKLGNPVAVGLGSGTTTAAGSASMSWIPAATPTDLAGNLSSTTSATESGTADREF
jgi:hypothetical protein